MAMFDMAKRHSASPTPVVMDEIYVKTQLTDERTTPAGPALAGVLFIPNMKRYDLLHQQDICYVKGDKSHVSLHLANGQKMSVSTHLGNFIRYLDKDWFVRTSRSHIINLRYVEAVTTRSIILKGKVIPLTEAYRSALWQRLPIVRLKSD